MPIIEITYPAHALNQEQCRDLTEHLTPLIAKWEGQPDNKVVISNTWVVLHEQPLESFTVGARLQTSDIQPRYLVTVKAPEGAFIVDGKQGLADELTRAILAVEGKKPDDSTFLRIWCIFQDVPDGSWSYGGRILTRQEVAAVTRRV